MNDVISAWIDEDEMRRLAESLLSRPFGQDLNRLEIHFGKQFEGFANEFVSSEEDTALVSENKQSEQRAEPAYSPPPIQRRPEVESFKRAPAPVERPPMQGLTERIVLKARVDSPSKEDPLPVEIAPVPKSSPTYPAQVPPPQAPLEPVFQQVNSPQEMQLQVQAPVGDPIVSSQLVVPQPVVTASEPEFPPPVQNQEENPTAPPLPGQSEPQHTGATPSMVRSAVQFLRKAQAEGKAGGVIRGVKGNQTPSPTPTPPPRSPSDISTVAVSATPEPPLSRPIHSPFRRLADVEGDVTNQFTPVEEPQTPPVHKDIPVEAIVPLQALRRPPIPSGDEPILARVNQFGKWLKGPLRVRNFFVSNTAGKVLIDELGNPKLIQVARSLSSASGTTSETEVGSLHVRIGDDAILEVVPTPSQFGTLILGLIVEAPLSEEAIREVRLGLEEVANARLIKK